MEVFWSLDPALGMAFRDLRDFKFFITGADAPWAAGWYDEDLKCFCHLVKRDGVIERSTSPTMAGPFEPRTEPFDGEERFTGVKPT